MNTDNKVYQARVSAVRGQLAEWQVEGVLIRSPENRRWLSGFTGSAGTIIITADKALLGTDFRYWSRTAGEAPDFDLVKLEGNKDSQTELLLKEAAVSSLGVEGSLTLDDFQILKKNRGDVLEFKVIENTVEPFRAVKTMAEIEAIQAAAAITDLAMSAVNDMVRPGLSEQQVAWELERTMREAGADQMAFPVIVASGPNSAFPHHHSGARKLEIGDTIIVDIGAGLNGYMSDMTRSFHLGSEPDDRFWEIYNTVLEAQERALNAIQSGEKGSSIDAAARDFIETAGFGDHFGHGLGHGVGLEIHEAPRLSPSAEDNPPIEAGAVVTVEPGIYIEGWGGVRIEDLILVTENGFKYISKCSKNPIIRV